MKNRIRIFLTAMASLVLFFGAVRAQPDSSVFRISGYLETYYLFDTQNPDDHQRPDFVYSYNRHNEFTVNLAFVRTDYTQSRVRAGLALMAGTYANANLATEPGVLKNIYEARGGVRVSRQKNLWIDVGIFPSHIGAESAEGINNWNLTRSLAADNSPYYESGAKISYTSAKGTWFLSGLILNGWQRIQRKPGNNFPAFGHQVTYLPNERVTLNSSSFARSDEPDSTRKMRYFHNFYGQFQLTSRLGALVSFDIGAQQARAGSTRYSVWMTPGVQLRYAVSENARLAARLEHYADPDGVIISSPVAGGFRVSGLSVNFDYAFLENALWRIEAKRLGSQQPVFAVGGGRSHQNLSFTTALALRFP
jgi:hypothetical protein